MKKIGEQLEIVIKNKEFLQVSQDLIEVAIDSKISDELLKDVPILSTIIGVYNTYTNLKDSLFSKKLLTFLFQLKTIQEERIIDQIELLEKDNKYRTRVGEKLLYIIDRCEDPDKASFTGIMFKVFLEENINYHYCPIKNKGAEVFRSPCVM